jgi:hypothetical protein
MKLMQTYKTNKLPYIVNDINPEENWDSKWTGQIKKYQILSDALNEFYDGKFRFCVGIIENPNYEHKYSGEGSGCVYMYTDNSQLIFRSGEIELRSRNNKVTSSKWKFTDWRIETCLPGGRTISG